MKKIILGIVLVLLFAFSFGLIYLNNVYLPVKVKGRLASSLSTSLKYNVEIGRLRFNFIRGVILQDIAVYDKVKDKENTILTIKEASFQFLVLPLIKERKIIIPVINVDSPYLHIRYQTDNRLNFAGIFSSPSKQHTKSNSKFSFLVYKIKISDGAGLFEDEHLEPKFTKNIQDLNIVVGMAQLTKIAFLIEGALPTEKGVLTELSLRGDYSFLRNELDAKLNLSHLIIPDFNPYLKEVPLSISGGAIDSAALTVQSKDNLISLKGLMSAKGLLLRKQNLALAGDMDIEPDLRYDINQKTLNYQANIKFINGNLLGLQYVDRIDNISGEMGLIKDKLWTDNLKLQALDSAFVLQGELDNFTNPLVKLNLKTEQVNLEKIMAILPFKAEGLTLNGVAAVDINIDGNLNKLPLDTRVNLLVKDARLQTALLKEPVNNINGKVNYTTDTLNWQDLSFDYLAAAYTSSGKLANFQTPQINFGLNSKDLDLKSDVKIKNKIIRLNAFAGKYLNSEFDIKGDIDTQDKVNPALNLSARINLRPSDVLVFLPVQIAEDLKKRKLEGIFNINASLNGKARDYKDWDLFIKANSDSFSLYNLKFQGLSFNLEQKDRILNINRLIAAGYSGSINLTFASDLNPDPPNYLLKFNASGIDLGKLKLDTDLKDKDIAGILNINADLNGDFKDSGSLKGNGALFIKDGKLWQLNFFKGLAELFLSPDYEKIIFKEAKGEFNIQNKSISTENLHLVSDQLNLDFQGKLGFDGTLDFTIYTQVNKNLIRDSADIRKFTAAILGELSNALTIKLSGTTQNPKYKIVPVAVDLLKNIKDFFLGK